MVTVEECSKTKDQLFLLQIKSFKYVTLFVAEFWGTTCRGLSNRLELSLRKSVYSLQKFKVFAEAENSSSPCIVKDGNLS